MIEKASGGVKENETEKDGERGGREKVKQVP